MKKIRFFEDRTVNDGSGTTFEKDKVYELSDPSADRWVRRGVAEYVRADAHASEPRIVTPTGDDKPVSAAERQAQQESLAQREKLGARGRVTIPKKWEEMEWAEMRALATRLSDDPIKSKEDAKSAIEAELKRREAPAAE